MRLTKHSARSGEQRGHQVEGQTDHSPTIQITISCGSSSSVEGEVTVGQNPIEAADENVVIGGDVREDSIQQSLGVESRTAPVKRCRR